jgi:hypothetical protein
VSESFYLSFIIMLTLKHGTFAKGICYRTQFGTILMTNNYGRDAGYIEDSRLLSVRKYRTIVSQHIPFFLTTISKEVFTKTKHTFYKIYITFGYCQYCYLRKTVCTERQILSYLPQPINVLCYPFLALGPQSNILNRRKKLIQNICYAIPLPEQLNVKLCTAH